MNMQRVSPINHRGTDGRAVRVLLAAALTIGLLAVLAGCVGPGTNEVLMHNLEYNPASLTVPVGTTVTWKNGDQTAYLVTSDKAGAFASPKPLNPGETYSFKFTTPGTFTYTDQFQPYMHGVIVVK